MKKRVYHNPVINDTATFVETSEESNGRHTIAEIELYQSSGPPLHYHNAFAEKFVALEGIMHIQVGNKHITLQPGEEYTVNPGTPHKFYNPTSNKARFKVVIEPGHTGMENFIQILYGLAADGLTDGKSIPKKFAHLATILVMSDTNTTGMMTLMSPIIRWVAARSKKNGTEKYLLEKYCV